jgi:hypothetical protein
MGADRIIEVADAIVSTIDAQVAALDEAGNPIAPALFTADRTYGVAYTNPELATLRVDVRHPAVQTEEESRGAGSKDTYGIEIAVQQTVPKTDKAAIDALIVLARRLARTFPVSSVLMVGDNEVQVTENLHLVFDPEKLNANRFFSLISLAIQEYAS